MASNVIDTGAGVVSGNGLLNTYYNFLNSIYGTLTAGTVTRIDIGPSYATLSVTPPSVPVPKAPNPPTTVNGTPWAQTDIRTGSSSPVPVATFVSTYNIAGGWTARTLPFGAGKKSIAWNGSVFCVVMSNSGYAATSPDGITWTLHPIGTSLQWYSIAWNGFVFCAVPFNGNYAATSPDGVTWTTTALPTGPWKSIAWNGSVFCAIAGSGGGSNAVLTSPDGITWSAHTLPAMFGDSAAITSNGSIFCAVPYNGSSSVYTSPDGITWAAHTLPTAGYWAAVAWNGSVFCAVIPGTNTAATSPDGVAWTARTLSSSQNWQSVAAKGSTLCTVPFNGGISSVSSDNGASWHDTPMPASTYWCSIAASNDVFCAVDQVSGTGATLALAEARSITQADIDAFNAAHAGDGVTAQFVTDPNAPDGDPVPAPFPILAPAPSDIASAIQFDLDSLVDYTVFYDGIGRVFNFKIGAWQPTATADCQFHLTDFPYTLDGIAGDAADLSPYGVVLSQTFKVAGDPVIAVWGKSSTGTAAVEMWVAGAPLLFGGEHWQALNQFSSNGWDNSWSLQRFVSVANPPYGFFVESFLTWDAAELSAPFHEPGLALFPDTVFWVYLTSTGELRAISNRTTMSVNTGYGVYDFGNHLGSEFPRFVSENIVLYEIRPVLDGSGATVTQIFDYSINGVPGYSIDDYLYQAKTWRPPASGAPAVFYSVIDFPAANLGQWQAVLYPQETSVDGVPVPPPAQPSSGSGPLSAAPPVITAPVIRTLAGGSMLELAAPPVPLSLGGSLDELTAPPLPISSGGALLEHLSSVLVDTEEVSAGGVLQHLGLPFTLGA
jgi:hypothetical protein